MTGRQNVRSENVCTDCGRVFAADDLLRCGRGSGDDFVEVRLCVDCLYSVNPYMQRRLIEAAFNRSEAPGV